MKICSGKILLWTFQIPTKVYICVTRRGKGSPAPPTPPPNLPHPPILTNQIAPFIEKKTFPLRIITKTSEYIEQNTKRRAAQHNTNFRY